MERNPQTSDWRAIPEEEFSKLPLEQQAAIEDARHAHRVAARINIEIMGTEVGNSVLQFEIIPEGPFDEGLGEGRGRFEAWNRLLEVIKRELDSAVLTLRDT